MALSLVSYIVNVGYQCFAFFLANTNQGKLINQFLVINRKIYISV